MTSNFSEQWLSDYEARTDFLPATRQPPPVSTSILETTTIILALSVPPSVNEMFANVPGVGRVKTAKYRAWRKTALNEALLGMIGKRRIKGLFTATIWVTANNGGDIDNRVKATLDLCKTAGAITDDKRCIALHVYRIAGKNGLWIRLDKANEADIPLSVPLD